MTVFIGIIGGLAVFLYGMKTMSGGLQTVAGDKMRSILRRATDNRIKGVATGFLTTTVIQSSSATTVMMVTFVNAGLLNLMQSTGIIMGANIGTTVTGWLVSLLGFKVKISAFALPAVGIGVVMGFLKRNKISTWGDVLVGFGLLFLGLSMMKEALPNMHDSPEMATWLHRYTASGYTSTLMVISVGTVITMLVQSSSAVMAVTLAAAVNGLIDFPTAAALVLGENIGTTVTALMAGLGSGRNALRAASIHTMFNTIGVLWVWLAFPVFLVLVDALVPGAPTSPDMVPNHVAMFHTTFNICNTLLMLPFATHLARIATRIVPEQKVRKIRLRTLDGVFVSVPKVAVDKAARDAQRMALNVLEMFDEAVSVLHHPTRNALPVGERVNELENEVDDLEREINDFLIQLSQNEIAPPLAARMRALLEVLHDLERAGDYAKRVYIIGRTRQSDALELSGEAVAELASIASSVRELIVLLIAGLARPQEDLFSLSRKLERTIDEACGSTRVTHVDRLLDGRCKPESAGIFLDAVAALRNVGHHLLRVAEMLTRVERQNEQADASSQTGDVEQRGLAAIKRIGDSVDDELPPAADDSA